MPSSLPGRHIQFHENEFMPSQKAVSGRGGSDPTPGIRDPDLFGLLGSVRWDPDLLVNDPDLKEDPDPI